MSQAWQQLLPISELIIHFQAKYIIYNRIIVYFIISGWCLLHLLYLSIGTIIVYVEPIFISRFDDGVSIFLLCQRFLLLEPREKWGRWYLSICEVLRHEEGLEHDKVDEDECRNGEENLQHVITSI